MFLEVNMTLQQIERTREFLALIDSAQGLTAMQELVDEMRTYYGESFSVNLKATDWTTKEMYTLEYNARDKSALKGFLEGYLAKENSADVICGILDLIKEGENLKNNESEMYKFILKIYHSYSGKIKFDKSIEIIATAPKEAIRSFGYQITKEMVSGIVIKLRSFANELIQVNNREISTGNKQEINFHPQINVEAKNETNINLEAIFENARQQADDLGLSDEQYNVIMDKLSELEKLANSKESKGKRWQKVKEFMKWLVEQGVQVAGILLPVLVHTIQ